MNDWLAWIKFFGIIIYWLLTNHSIHVYFDKSSIVFTPHRRKNRTSRRGNWRPSSSTNCATSAGAITSPPRSTCWWRPCSGSIPWSGGSGPGWWTSESAPAMKKCWGAAPIRKPMPKASCGSAAGMRPRHTAMAQDVGVIAASIFQGIA